MNIPYTLEVESWETPATKYPLKRLGSAEITRRKQPRGYYRMEGVNGHIFYHHKEPMQITALEISGEVVMIDDPLHWYGMKGLASHSKGKVLVGGLGLGLLVHALAENPKVSGVDVVEINSNVLNLITPLLPSFVNLNFLHRDVYDQNAEDYDTIILDLWVKTEKTNTLVVGLEMRNAFMFFKSCNPKADVFIWGHGDSAINPTVNAEVRKRIPKTYWDVR